MISELKEKLLKLSDEIKVLISDCSDYDKLENIRTKVKSCRNR